MSTESENPFLLKLLGSDPLPTGDLQKFLSEGFSTLMTNTISVGDALLSDEGFLRNKTNLLPMLIQHNVETRRMSELLLQCLGLLDHALCNRSSGISCTAAMIRLTHVSLRYIIEACAGDCILLEKQLRDASSHTMVAAYKLCCTSADYIMGIDITVETSFVHMELLQLLIIMCSTQLHHKPQQDPLRRDLFVESIFSSTGEVPTYSSISGSKKNGGTILSTTTTAVSVKQGKQEAEEGRGATGEKDSRHFHDQEKLMNSRVDNSVLLPFLPCLIRRLIDWNLGRLPDKQFLYAPGAQPRFGNFFNLFGTMSGSGAQDRISVADVIGRRSVDLFLILTFYQKSGTVSSPSIIFVSQWEDGEPVDFEQLILAIGHLVVHCPELTMLLYLFLHENPQFLPHVIQGKDSGSATATMASISPLAVLVGELLHLLHITSSGMMIYLIATIFLMFTHDGSFGMLLHSWTINPSSWFKERHLMNNVTMGSLFVMCFSKTASRAILADKNLGIASATTGALANGAPFVHQLDPYAAQRVMFVTLGAMKRVNKLYLKAQGKDHLSVMQDLESTSGYLIILLEVIVSMLAGSHVRENYSLIYELLYNKEQLFLANVQEKSAKIHAALAPLHRLVSFYEIELASVSVVHTAEDILALIKRVSSDVVSLTTVMFPKTNAAESQPPQESIGGSSSNKVGSATEKDEIEDLCLAFDYHESAQSCDYFTPLLWSIIVGCEKGDKATAEEKSRAKSIWGERPGFELLQVESSPTTEGSPFVLI